MKKMKKIASLALAAVMTLGLAAPVFADVGGGTETRADATYTITIENDTEGHTYQAYQIFKGKLSQDGTVLSDITWGTGVALSGSEFEGHSAADVSNSLQNAQGAEEFSKKIGKCLSDTYVESVRGNNEYVISGLESGYYLVKDKDDSLKENADDVYTRYLLKVVKNIGVKPKGNKPTLDKQIYHNEKDSWGVVGDNQIGDTVQFRVITFVPDPTGYVYEKDGKIESGYIYTIHDTMSEGLTSNVKTKSDIVIKIENKDDKILGEDYYDVDANGNTFALKIDLLKAVTDKAVEPEKELYIYYSGVLNENAVIYDVGNQKNTASLEYSHNPYDSTETGKTPEITVYDWTYKLNISKVNSASNPLTGAKFVLSKENNLDLTKILDENEALITNPTEEQKSEFAKLIPLKKVENGYRVTAEKEGGSGYEIELGTASIEGLDDDKVYYLYEILAPDGYNKKPGYTSLKVQAEYEANGETLQSGYPKIIVDNKQASSNMSVNIVNNKGNVLPETGGIGTTIFYVVGGLLMAVAAVLLITRKRMSMDDEE